MPTFNSVTVKIEQEIDVDVDFEVYCEKCGAGLCNNSKTRSSRNRGIAQVTIYPCENCLEKAKEEGRQEGYDEARQKIYDEAYDKGFECGQKSA